ncbi:transposase family protein [Psychrobacter pocilloporae]|uniref:transposase family protein n=1 Tax=Psychrobacter pocilloporae TaxID=1775882 RepID=UPI003C2C7324
MSTNQLSLERQRQSRNMQEDILHAIAERKQVNVARHLGVEPSTVGRWIDAKNQESQVVRFCDMLAFCGLKIVPANAQCYNKEKIDILFHITKYHFQNLEAVDDFFQNDAGMTDSTDARYSRTADLPDTNATTTVFGWVASLYAAIKASIAARNEAVRPSVLVARQNANAEIEEERQALNADEQKLWNLFYILIHVVLVLVVLSAIYRFWG